MSVPSGKIVISGGAGLVGQNLVLLLHEKGYENLVAIDKHAHNLSILENLNPGVRTVHADLAQRGGWENEFEGAVYVVQLHSQITGLNPGDFVRNNLVATKLVLGAMKRYQVPYLIHVSSSVVNSVANDDYTNTKKAQEELVRSSGIAHCVLRPTLMFGWFDPKHLGWLSRFMEWVPIFPIPGDGKYMRQPLYNRDFCRMIEWCVRNRPQGTVYDVVGEERVNYVDIIRTIKAVKRLQTWIVHIPYWLFDKLLRLYSVFSRRPPFTADQLKALTAGDDFKGVDIERTFGFRPTPFVEAMRETFTDPRYSRVVLKRL
jgi:nucleoside-diphosphate-sugar epimerase